MTPVSKYPKHATHTHIIQLPEQIFCEIFKYLKIETIMITLRAVCKKIKDHVDSYIKIKGIFMLTGEKSSIKNEDAPAKIIHIFQINYVRLEAN